MVVLCFAVALPQAPGYVGVFQIASERTLTGLSDKVHTLKLVVLGTHHKGGTGTWVTVDRFLVT